MTPPVQRMLDALRAHGCDPKPSRNGWASRCPAHDDRSPSLSVGEGDNGGAVVKCHAGCGTTTIVTKIGLTLADLMPERSNGTARAAKPRVSKPAPPPLRPTKAPTKYTTSAAAIAALEKFMGPQASSWTYLDAHGEPVMVVVRFPLPSDSEQKDEKPRKTFRPVGRDGGAWIIGDPPGLLPLYGLSQLSALPKGARVYVCEGEKAADAVRAMGGVATTSAHGAGSAAKTDWSVLAGMDVVLMPDRDEAGDGYVAEVAEHVAKVGPECVRIVRLADKWPALPDGGDAADVLAMVGEDSGSREAAFAEIEALVEAAAPETPSQALSEDDPIDICDLVAKHPDLRPAIIDRLLRQGEVLNIIAPPKRGKSWLVAGLAISVAMGIRWLGSFDIVNAGPVLILDNELHDETLAFRLPKVAGALGIPLAQLRGRLYVKTYRGGEVSMKRIRATAKWAKARGVRLIIIDAMYRLATSGVSENDNAAMARLYCELDVLAAESGAAICVIHHSSKGSQADKDVHEVGSGAGSQSRAADNHLILRDHNEPGVVVLDAVVRSWAPLEPICLRWNFPIWRWEEKLNPEMLKGKRGPRSDGGKANTDSNPMSVDEFAAAFISATNKGGTVIVENAAAKGVARRAAGRLLKMAVEEKKAFKTQHGRNQPAFYSTTPPPQTEDSNAKP